jgi:pyruvate/2-oxoglutarate dehydrogenase complex dihydrolipoamide acyltransferase (E2) component
MPRLEQSKRYAKIIEWRRREGGQIKIGEVLYVIETTKATYYMEAKVSGTLSKILVPAGEYVDTPAVVGIITQNEKERGPGSPLDVS